MQTGAITPYIDVASAYPLRILGIFCVARDLSHS